MNADELIVKRGDPIRPAWERLIEWIRGLKVITGPNIRLNVTPQGVIATVDRVTSPYGHPWKVSAGEVITIQPGTVRNLPAEMYSSDKQQVRLDGLYDSGRPADNPNPTLDIDFSKHDDEGKFYVAVTIDLDEGEWDQDDSWAVYVDQFDHIPQNGHALACVHLNEDRTSVEEVFQIAYHNLDVSIKLATGGYKGQVDRVLFFPV